MYLTAWRTGHTHTLAVIFNMTRLRFILLFFFISCGQGKDTHINFNYKFMKSDSGILIENYRPVTRKELTKYLTKVNDTLKLKKANILLNAENIQEINPEFKKRFYSGSMGRTELSYVNNDTSKSLRRTNFSLGTFKEDTFIKNDSWDSLLLDNRFFMTAD